MGPYRRIASTAGFGSGSRSAGPALDRRRPFPFCPTRSSRAGTFASSSSSAEIAAASEREQLSYPGVLAELVMAECDDRDTRRSVRRIVASTRAALPRSSPGDQCAQRRGDQQQPALAAAVPQL